MLLGISHFPSPFAFSLQHLERLSGILAFCGEYPWAEATRGGPIEESGLERGARGGLSRVAARNGRHSLQPLGKGAQGLLLWASEGGALGVSMGLGFTRATVGACLLAGASQAYR
jgi:hypothetical protein